MPSPLSSVRTTAAVTVVAATAVVVSIWTVKCIQKYGLEGTIRYIWEGDHLTPEIRNSVNTLQEVSDSIPAQESILERVQVALERARLDSIDDDQQQEQWNILPQWLVNYEGGDLEKDLYMTSQKLDSLAAKVDSVPSHGDQDVKQQKKHFSQQIVQMMERADMLLACYEGRADKDKQ